MALRPVLHHLRFLKKENIEELLAILSLRKTKSKYIRKLSSHKMSQGVFKIYA